MQFFISPTLIGFKFDDIVTQYTAHIHFFHDFGFYPNNKDEAKQVEKYIESRTQKDIDFFYKTNKSVVFAFKPYVKESLEELSQIELSQDYIIFAFKCLINRARPEQVDNSIKPIDTSTAETPAFPAGHAYQAHVLYKILSKKYPEKKDLFEKLSYDCDLCRIKAGLHYPSDGEYSRQLVNLFYN